MSRSHPYQKLMQIEVGSIQQYIFEGRRLREIRGASALLETANRTHVPSLVRQHASANAEVLRSTGSVTVVGFTIDPSDGAAGHIQDAVRQHYARHVPGATCHIGEVACQGIPLQQALNRLSYQMAMQEGAAPSTDDDLAAMDPLARYCDSCGLRPSADTLVVGDTGEVLCRVCLAKARHGIKVRGFRSDDSIIQRFARYADKSPGWEGIDVADVLPDDLTDVAGDGDVALILTDGNRLGQRLRHLTDVSQYKRFAEGVAHVVEEATFSALAKFGPRQSKRGGATLPWEILFLGGDDVLVATESTIALSIAQDIMEQVEQKSSALFDELGFAPPEESKQPPQLSMATGVAVGPASYPFRALHDLAMQLEGTAKKRAYRAWETTHRDTSTIDFHRITASGRTQIERVRQVEQRPHRPSPGQPVRLTQRPFTREEMADVLRVAQAWKHVPNSKVHYLRDRLFVSPAEAARGWAHVVGRARADERRNWHTLQELPGDRSGAVPAPWQQSQHEDSSWTTYLLDVIDARALVA